MKVIKHVSGGPAVKLPNTKELVTIIVEDKGLMPLELKDNLFDIEKFNAIKFDKTKVKTIKIE